MPVLQVGVWLIPRICDTSGAFHAAECTFHTGMRLKQGYIYIIFAVSKQINHQKHKTQ